MNNYNDSQVKIKKLNCSSLPNKEKPEFNKIKPKIFLKKEFSYYNIPIPTYIKHHLFFYYFFINI